MAVPLVASTLAIIEQVRERTGKDVVVSESNETQVGFAKVKIARKGMDSHLILLDKARVNLASYLVAHECGHILRLFATPEGQRKVPMTNERTRRIALSQIQDDIVRLSRTIPERVLAQMVQLWYQGIITQVTSQPADIMIERWLYREYPELRPLQKKAIDSMHREAVTALKPRVAVTTPRKVYATSTIMNYAFFAALDDGFGSSYLKPFRSSRHAADGERLKALTLREPWDSLAGDIQMSNAWAEFLGIRSWFEWTDYENVPPGYVTS